MSHSSLVLALSLAYTPITNYEFSFIKEEKIVQEHIKASKLYMICQRPRIKFNFIEASNDGILKFEIVQDNSSKKISGTINLYQECILNGHEGLIDVVMGSHDKDKIVQIPCYGMDGFIIETRKKEFLSWFSPEKLIYEFYERRIDIDGMGGWQELLNYKVLYVGQATQQEIWKRLSNHSTLQEILSKELPLSKESIPTHEIALLLFQIDSMDKVTVKEILSAEDLLHENKETISHETVFLDAEKLFVKLLNPYYNKIRFSTYPKSKDGLHKYNLNSYYYTLKDPIIIECNGVKIRGAHNIINSDIIKISKNEIITIISD